MRIAAYIERNYKARAAPCSKWLCNARQALTIQIECIGALPYYRLTPLQGIIPGSESYKLSHEQISLKEQTCLAISAQPI